MERLTISDFIAVPSSSSDSVAPDISKRSSRPRGEFAQTPYVPRINGGDIADLGDLYDLGCERPESWGCGQWAGWPGLTLPSTFNRAAPHDYPAAIMLAPEHC